MKKTSLTRKNKEAIGILGIGTFLEYFDLMLYVHMAVLLNDLFFPKSDPHTTALLSALTFSSSFVFRPLGAFIFGLLGDKFGRVIIIISTSILMALSCLVMFAVPTYAQIGIASAWIVIICRIVQSISSMGEIVGAKLYLTEMIEPPLQYPVVTLIQTAAALGGTASLCIASYFTIDNYNWRYVFLMGGIIALLAYSMRKNLIESRQFSDVKKRVEKHLKEKGEDQSVVERSTLWLFEKINWTNSFFLFAIDCMWPICFYFSYNYCSTILKTMGYSPHEIIFNNLFVSLFDLAGMGLIAWLSYYIYPLTILRIKFVIFSILILATPYLLTIIKSPSEIFLLQSSVIFLGLSPNPASSIFFKYFPILKRFSVIAIAFSLSRAIMYVVTSFGMIYAADRFSHYGLLFIVILPLIGFYFGIRHFSKLEKETGLYPDSWFNFHITHPIKDEEEDE